MPNTSEQLQQALAKALDVVDQDRAVPQPQPFTIQLSITLSIGGSAVQMTPPKVTL